MDWFKNQNFFFPYILPKFKILCFKTNVFSPQALSANQIKSEIIYGENQKQNNFTELGQNTELGDLVHTHLL